MGKFLKVLMFLVLAGFLFAIPMSASATIINDNYWGAAPSNDSYTNRDVIGDDQYFGISKMEVTFQSGNMYVDIYSRYLDNIGKYGTELGDLFISTNGWSPYGATPPYGSDNASNGEKWEYALVMDNHSPNCSSGSVNLYNIKNHQINIQLSPNFSGTYRKGQEVQYDPSDAENVFATGSWSFNNMNDTTDENDFLRFIISADFIDGADALGFHYVSANCANDVIEGGAPVPEPATMLLLGVGLIGLAGFGRKKLKRKA